MINAIVALICGVLFGCGLTISMMINPNKVIHFLDITGQWDPSLLLVMASALIVATMGYHWINRQEKKPLFAKKFFLPVQSGIDAQLLIGAAIFGIGWGLGGYCPGPAITALGLGIADAFYMFIGMIVSALTLYFFKKHDVI